MTQVGDKIWHFEENRRTYTKDERGHSTGGPIWIKHWHEVEILGETRVSWSTTYGKVSKRELAEGRALVWAATYAEVEDRAWVHVHQPKIANKLIYSEVGADKLKQIAELMGYEP